MSSPQRPDINKQIDRILSSNIHSQLLSGIPLQLLQSPAIVKTESKYKPESAASCRFQNREELEEDLYEKAEQIFKLKEVLESQLANINQIVIDNQKLTEVNRILTTELEKIRDEWIIFKQQIIQELKSKSIEIQMFGDQQITIMQEINLKNFKKPNLQIHSYSTSLVFEPQNKNFGSNSVQTEFDQNSQKQIKNLQTEVNRLNLMIASLEVENYAYKEQIKTIEAKIVGKASKTLPQPLREKQLNQQSIDFYSSVFMKSMFQDEQNIQQTIRKVLFNPQKPIFAQLQQAKYFGKIVSRAKNGNAIQQYKNGFQYEGKFLKNQRHGIGKLIYKDKLIYAGQWRNGRFEGKGILYYYLNLNVQKIEANFRNGLIEGLATVSFLEGNKIWALFKNNLMENQGYMTLSKNCHQFSLRKKSYLGNRDIVRDKQNIGKIDKQSFEAPKELFIEI